MADAFSAAALRVSMGWGGLTEQSKGVRNKTNLQSSVLFDARKDSSVIPFCTHATLCTGLLLRERCPWLLGASLGYDKRFYSCTCTLFLISLRWRI